MNTDVEELTAIHHLTGRCRRLDLKQDEMTYVLDQAQSSKNHELNVA